MPVIDASFRRFAAFIQAVAGHRAAMHPRGDGATPSRYGKVSRAQSCAGADEHACTQQSDARGKVSCTAAFNASGSWQLGEGGEEVGGDEAAPAGGGGGGGGGDPQRPAAAPGPGSRSVEKVSSGRSEIPPEMPSLCLIFPHRLLIAAPHALVHALVVRAYDLHAEANRQVEQRFGADWLVRGHWSEFAKLWCSSVPLLVGQVVGRGELAFLADRRAWEPLRAREDSEEDVGGRGTGNGNSSRIEAERRTLHYQHYISDSRSSLRSVSSSSGQRRAGDGADGTVMELAPVDSTLGLADVCEASAHDSGLWRCSFYTTVEDAAGNVRVCFKLARQELTTPCLVFRVKYCVVWC